MILGESLPQRNRYSRHSHLVQSFPCPLPNEPGSSGAIRKVRGHGKTGVPSKLILPTYGDPQGMSLWSTFRGLFIAGKAVMSGLSEEDAGTLPLPLFARWFRDAKRAGILLPESMALATATPDGRPSIRFVLLKAYGEEGFVFYTNYGSRKALEMDENPEASLIFHWVILQRQIRLDGRVERISTKESEAYFHSRSRGSQLGAWASAQSDPMANRKALEDRVRKYEKEFKGKEIPLPPFWGGYRLKPRSIEFWQGRANRLHDRIKFIREGEGWDRTRLYP